VTASQPPRGPDERSDQVVFSPPHNTSAKATASLVLGIVGVLISPTFICAVLAVLLGHQAREEIALDPRIEGHGVATAGFVLGIVGLVIGMLVMVVALATG
jgi:hypothetical protein